MQIYFNITKLFRKFEKKGFLEEGRSNNQNVGFSHLTTKVLPPFGEESQSANENAGFPVTAKPHGNKSNENAGFPVAAKPHVEEEGCSAKEHAGF